MSAPRLAWFRLYAAEYLADVDLELMPLEAQGAYLRLLCHLWVERRGLAADDAILARVLKLPIDEFRDRIWPAIRDRFLVENGRLLSPRLEQERSEAQERSERAQAAAGVRWRN